MTGKTKIVEAVVEDTEHKVLVPEETSTEDYSRGVVLGPPNLKLLGYLLGSNEDLEDLDQRLQHELFVRGVITYKDALRQRQDIFGALFSALKLDVDKITEMYREFGPLVNS